MYNQQVNQRYLITHPYTYPTIITQFFNNLLGTQMFFGDIEIDIVWSPKKKNLNLSNN